ncbi:MAG: HigA family addiction module antidote protein [Alphaproteobacteria bacterium]|jgi:addiction module HigA family antidote|nr:HigA family addiction module antidote protein [Alphaproteobacteria bacterium]
MSKSSTIMTDGASLLSGLPPVHPGEILRDELAGITMSADALAHAIAIPSDRITELLDGKRDISADTALRLSYYFGMSARFWLNLQQSYDLALIEQTRGPEIAATVRPYAA